MRKSEMAKGIVVRVKDSHKSRPLRGLVGVVQNFYKQPSGWTAVKVSLPGFGVRTLQPAQLDRVSAVVGK